MQPGVLRQYRRRLQQLQWLSVGSVCQQWCGRLRTHCLQGLQYRLGPMPDGYDLLRRLRTGPKVQRQYGLLRLRYQLRRRLHLVGSDLRQQSERRLLRPVHLRYELRR